MVNKIQKLVLKLKESFKGKPWFGDSLIHKLNKINYQDANIVVTDSSKSIAMIIQHLINWRVFVIEKLKRNESYAIIINSNCDWSEIKIESELEWTKLLNKLIFTQAEIIKILEDQMINNQLENIVPGESYSFESLLIGIIHHDIYHSGQIGLLFAQLKSNT
ncbi:DinB family protein [Ichthyenterobacterium magnum]|uniref:DinB family protein n=1 Tax=Ichthyenterobacterium magnum TaxID=1230530 RepID=A0A420DVC9_9FLAO|nr:DinB family protein [Ichthyenterobacterium magnum]RKE98127.1 hypothetical protein BXY80_0201 [Ichthyenterobacterium magnum]